VVHFSGHGGKGAARAERLRDAPRRDVARPSALQTGAAGSGGTAEHGDAAGYGLYFQGPDGRARVVSAAALRDTFGAAGSSVRLVILNACYSEPQADALLEHVDCVVGMAGSIYDDAARSFAIGFYGGLGERESIEAAYKQGCAAIGLEGLPHGDRPHLKARGGVNPGQVVLADPR
jgi:hypothetical protein